MKTLVILSLLFTGFSAFSAVPIGEKFMLPGVSYVNSGTTVVTTTTGPRNLVTRTEDGKTFYLSSLTVEGTFDVLSATATRLGYCSLQVPNGTTVASWSFSNPTTSAVDRVVIPNPWPLPITASFAVSCSPKTATAVDWAVNYTGFEY